jgi:MFS family permease
VALVVAIVFVVIAPETRQRAVPLPNYRPQRITVPARARGQFFAAMGGAAIAFSALGLFTSLAGVFLEGTLHKTSLALAGATVFAVFAGAVVMQFITQTWSRRMVLLAGMALMIAGLGLVVVAAWLSTPSLTAFLFGGVVAGMGAGGVFKGSLGTVLMIADPEHRAESVAGLLLAGYIGLSVPAIGVGVALREVSTKSTLLGFVIAVIIAAVASAPALLRGQDGGPARSQPDATPHATSAPDSEDIVAGRRAS